ncbi:CRP-like cAMP-binding protein [Rhodoblastus acidophilus]|uniref:Crp/Fnr family transcriptional regulator n=1 Tax=Rhodoblastus acidophilus TaxID=1074 RepID=UPI0022245984|nr:Crp/Fnr family transcriptional regulator [Rhodoblastus acidophilus]MCW2282267.1 CRP-like cAMP-binding protein [Rhodoblastus acidophilus]MCW2331328.1 CRP-like cAMP-binding protein [Rhodoblastus acidophilus]
MTADHDTFLSRAPLFVAMGPELARSIVQNHTPRSCERGEEIYRQGDAADSCFFLIEGWVKVFRRGEQDEEVVAIYSAGDTFGESAMFVGGHYPASAQAVSPARVLEIDGAALRRILLENPQVAFSMLASFSDHLKHLVAQIDRLKPRSDAERIADFLLAQTTETAGAVTIALPYEKPLIASRLGMKPENFSRALVRLRDHGVKVCRDDVLISDVGRLSRYAARPPVGEASSGG